MCIGVSSWSLWHLCVCVCDSVMRPWPWSQSAKPRLSVQPQSPPCLALASAWCAGGAGQALHRSGTARRSALARAAAALAPAAAANAQLLLPLLHRWWVTFSSLGKRSFSRSRHCYDCVGLRASLILCARVSLRDTVVRPCTSYHTSLIRSWWLWPFLCVRETSCTVSVSWMTPKAQWGSETNQRTFHWRKIYQKIEVQTQVKVKISL